MLLNVFLQNSHHFLTSHHHWPFACSLSLSSLFSVFQPTINPFYPARPLPPSPAQWEQCSANVLQYWCTSPASQSVSLSSLIEWTYLLARPWDLSVSVSLLVVLMPLQSYLTTPAWLAPSMVLFPVTQSAKQRWDPSPASPHTEKEWSERAKERGPRWQWR